ncbi:ABC transporter ATP-binding protein [Devosia chinhatensis]|uniref:ABC transporter domain-containing protein n=1 Tax=Devosia chinhatensis TaxID=429727 RepID=A0A0F5FFJ8_9HYPH|nr:ABC transporter ATP-binding protein [Devosia chinhatensis]KKB07370.1 hypothetical protein VE26_11350 [Devosia chinhatensis]
MSVEVEGLEITRSGRAILSRATFSAPSAAITGLIGPNGAGKSTLLGALLGLLPASGSVRFDGQDLLAMPRRDRARLAALVEQSSFTEERLSVRDVVGLGRIPHQSALSLLEDGEGAAIIDDALAQTDLLSFSSRRFDMLSGGEQQRVHLARALAQQPRLLMLDEPTSHLDISAQLQLFALLQRKARSGMTVIIALHDLNLALRFCDHLVLVSGGTIAASGSSQEILTPHWLESAYNVRARTVADPITGRPILVYDEAAAAKPD